MDHLVLGTDNGRVSVLKYKENKLKVHLKRQDWIQKNHTWTVSCGRSEGTCYHDRCVGEEEVCLRYES